MKHPVRYLVAGLVVAGLLFSVIAWARPAFMKVFMQTYKIRSSSKLGKAQCAICHPSKTMTETLNPYGKDIQAAMKAKKAKMLTKDILQSVASMDSDKDGFRNIQEIKADTLPGDPKSHPLSK